MHDGDAEQRLDVHVMRLGLERVPEEDREVDSTFHDPRTGLLIAAERAAKESHDLQLKFRREQGASGAGCIQLVRGERVAVVARLIDEVQLAVVMRG